MLEKQFLDAAEKLEADMSQAVLDYESEISRRGTDIYFVVCKIFLLPTDNFCLKMRAFKLFYNKIANPFLCSQFKITLQCWWTCQCFILFHELNSRSCCQCVKMCDTVTLSHPEVLP